MARVLGEEIAVEHPEHGIAFVTMKDLRAEIEQLTGVQIEIRRQFRETEEELWIPKVA